MGSYQDKNQVNGEFSAYLLVVLLYFSLESSLILIELELELSLIPAVLKVKFFRKLIRSRIWQLSLSCQTGVWEYFPSSLALK